jgi:hypothetical protein
MKVGYVNIDGEVLDVDVQNYEYPMVSHGNREWYVFQDEEHAGKEAREYWMDMAENDQSEFVCIVGENNLVNWALGNMAGPGSTKVSSLEEWFDLWLNIPEEQWASYDGNVLDGTVSKEVMDELGFSDKNVVFYRHN